MHYEIIESVHVKSLQQGRNNQLNTAYHIRMIKKIHCQYQRIVQESNYVHNLFKKK